MAFPKLPGWEAIKGWILEESVIFQDVHFLQGQALVCAIVVSVS